MTDVYRNGTFESDPWRVVAPDEGQPSSGQLIVTKAQFLTNGHAVAPIGVLIEAGDSLDDLAGRLGDIALIVISFPKFNDGRGFSLARLLRERYGYKGPIRAIGDVLLDQIPHMIRVGFTEFTVVNEPTRRALLSRPVPEMPIHYQPAWTDEAQASPAAAHRPWLRQTW